MKPPPGRGHAGPTSSPHQHHPPPPWTLSRVGRAGAQQGPALAFTDQEARRSMSPFWASVSPFQSRKLGRRLSAPPLSGPGTPSYSSRAYREGQASRAARVRCPPYNGVCPALKGSHAPPGACFWSYRIRGLETDGVPGKGCPSPAARPRLWPPWRGRAGSQRACVALLKRRACP